MKNPIRVLVTGGSGNLAYSFLPYIARGEVFGHDQPVILHLMDIEAMSEQLETVVMELLDCAFPLLRDIFSTSSDMVAFLRIDYAFLIGAIPRRPGMERRDLLCANAKIFKVQGQALNRYAKKNVKVLVIGTPTNTNALICSMNAPSIPKENFTALSRLDHNRAVAQISAYLHIDSGKVKNIVIWGNHSNTMYPDFNHGTVESDGQLIPIYEAVKDENFLKETLIEIIRDRGHEILASRKRSSTLSAAKSIADHMKDWYCGTAKGEFVSMAVYSDGSYGVPEGVFYSFPVTIEPDHKWKIVPDLKNNEMSKEKIQVSGEELLKERELALEYFP